MGPLHRALGGMRDIDHWFVWRLEWDQEEDKYQKTPCALDGSVYRIDGADPSNWTRFETALRVVTELNARPECADKQLQYALGFWMTEDCGYWFLDLDKCVNDGVVSEGAAAIMAYFPGALMEFSSSGTGVHVIGNTVDAVPDHRTKPPKPIKDALAPMELEFYTGGRGIAFGLTLQAQGNADACFDDAVGLICHHYFPPREKHEEGEHDKPRADWKGPTDDDELIERALRARVSAAAAFGGKASFAQLWRGECEKNNESDMALAAHLAFWTGCDAPRIERLMRKSGLFREKWNTHRTYLRELTIQNACDGTKDVYREQERNMAAVQQAYGLPQVPTSLAAVTQMVASGPLVSDDMLAKVEELLAMVSACGTFAEMHNQVIPAIQAARIPPALGERLVKAVNKQLDIFDAKLPVQKLRNILFPPAVADTKSEEVPAWVQKHCYVKDGDYFLNMDNGATCSAQGFIAAYGRLMPLNDNGRRENPAEWALHRWGMTTVDRVAYRPDQSTYFDWDGLSHANTYSQLSVPTTAESYTHAGLAGITALQTHLLDMCARRQDVYLSLLYWIAHNVQLPGVKVRWSPVIKGTHGDGKTLMSMVIRAVMGYRNVGVTGNSTLTNTGGFNDWATGCAVNIIEEIMLTGKERYRLYNAMKEFISNDVVSINGKGVKSRKEYNCTNHIAFTNHNDAIPLEDADRRWFVVFTPWSDLQELRRYCGLDEPGWAARTAAIDYAYRNCAGEIRKWFLEMPIQPNFDPRGSAPLTEERQKMMASSRDDAESVTRNLIENGAQGVGLNVISTKDLARHLKIRALSDNFEIPKTSAMSHMLTRMGYSKLEKQLKYRDYPHTIWVKNGFSGDVREELDGTYR